METQIFYCKFRKSTFFYIRQDMGVPWIMLIMSTLLSAVSSEVVIELAETNTANLTNSNKDGIYTYIMYLKENNHVEELGNLRLVYVTGVQKDDVSFVGQNHFSYEFKEVDNGKYEFNATQLFDYETEYHQYTLVVKDVILQINIWNYDDENPTLMAPMCKMAENTIYDTTNTTCYTTLHDPDGWLSKTTFTVIDSKSGAENKLDMESNVFSFKIDQNLPDDVYDANVSITTLQTLDYKTRIFYSFAVEAVDSGKNPTTPKKDVTCLIDVEDLNDTPPKWTNYSSTLQITEKTPYTFNVTAVDGDKGRNKPIIYSVIRQDDNKDVCSTEPCISIETQEGKGLITINPINRDLKDLLKFTFDLMAQKDDEPPYSDNQTITLYIDDVDDNSPLVMSLEANGSTQNYPKESEDKIANFQFLENFAGTIDGLITITDIDTGKNAQFNVELLEHESKENNENYTDAFFVVPTAGYKTGGFQISVKNKTYLDYERPNWKMFQFYVHSFGTLNNTKEDWLLVNISLIDYNDELPIFENNSYTCSVNETIKKTEEIITVYATDKDAEDSTLVHRLVGPDTIIKLMNIDSDKGIITVGKDDAFDYDRINPVIFQVQAIDKVNHITTVSVTVNLLDVNNKAPTYKVDRDLIQVEENQNIGTQLNVTIIASDVDTTRDLIAEINWNKSYVTKNSLKKNLSDPVIQKAMQFVELKFEKSNEDSIDITLYISDINEDNTAPDYETFDTLYLDINITDLNTEVPEFEKMKSIDALIVINIIDINDNWPIFTEATNTTNYTVHEQAFAKTIVGRIEATDADVGDVVKYNCTFIKEKYDWFVCDKIGEISVVNTGTVDCDTDRIFTVNISCMATDGEHETYQNFSIYIKDKNNKIPTITDNDTNPIQIELDEQSPPNKYVTNFNNYTDQDRDIPFHTVSCQFENPNEDCFKSFYIKDNNVYVNLGYNDLNRDTGIRIYNCSLTCRDNPKNEYDEGQHIVAYEFKIKLNDINNNWPELKTPHLNASENMLQDSEIGAVVGKDIDEGINADINMTILSVTTDRNDFTEDELFKIVMEEDYYINKTYKQWHLKANKDLRDNYGEYTIQLVLFDLGDPTRSTNDSEDKSEQAKLTVVITKYNYQSPVFLFPTDANNNVTLTPDQLPNRQLILYRHNNLLDDIKISNDVNGNCNGKWSDTKFAVALSGESARVAQFFKIKMKDDYCTGRLIVDESYNKEEAKQIGKYTLTITATLQEGSTPSDKQEQNYRTDQEIVILFADLNDDPIFENRTAWEIDFLEDTVPQSERLPEYKKATYPNAGNEDVTVFYSLSSGQDVIHKKFGIDTDSGTVSISEPLDYLVSTSYEFEIQAAQNKSGKSAKDDSFLPVKIHVLDINNHVPEWVQENFFGAIMKSTQNGSRILKTEATDLDEIDEGKLTYTINGTIKRYGSQSIKNIVEPFKLDKDSGVLTLNFVVEPNMDGYFEFSITVKDVQDQWKNGPHYNTTTVLIYIVTETNTVNFKLENNLDEIVRKKYKVVGVISDVFKWECHDQSIEKDSQNGIRLDNVTVVSIYCINDNTLLEADHIKSKLNNLNTFQNLKQGLLQNGILLKNFDSEPSENLNNLETILKAALIGTGVVLGAISIILAVTFFLKTRSLNRRLKKLTEHKFGSDDSNMNRKAINAPTTNIFTAEGSNPVYNNEVIKEDLGQYDNNSVHSGDSDLIGVEDNPEFDIFAKNENLRF